MKKFLILALSLVAVACSKDNEEVQREWITLDFEAATFSSEVATNPSTWNFVQEGYGWQDGATSLSHESIFTHDYGYALYGGGLTISNYNTCDVSRFGSYEYDLYVYNAKNQDSRQGGGSGGSDNFLIAHGNFDSNVDAELDLRPTITFADGEPRMIKGCKVCSTSYFVNITENGNPFSPALKDGEQIKIYATGYDASGREGKTVEMVLARKGKIIKEWTAWNLSSLGEVVTVKFNIQGGNADEWGMTTPKYFAIDDIVVEKKE